MTAFLLLLMTLGQCGPAGCSRPQPPSAYATTSAWYARQAPDWGWHWAWYEGRVIPLWGYHPDQWTVAFDPTLPANVTMIAYLRTGSGN